MNAIALLYDEHKILKPLEEIEGLTIEYVIVDESFKLSKPYPDILLTVSDWRPEIARVLFEAKELNIPSLMFQDGTLDWIIQNRGDVYGGTGGPTHYQPILTDKLAVIGAQSARVLAAWNDPSKVEITGFPILQNEINTSKIYNQKIQTIDHKSIKVLVTSPRQGWFCEEHKLAFVAALVDLKSYLNSQPEFETTWRLSRNLAELIGVENEMKIKESSELVPLIQSADIVISAQSTVVVEAMLHNKPVAIIDYLNSPQFYPSAWFISSKEQIKPTINSMIKKEANRMLFQLQQLMDILQIDENSIENSKMLIEQMISFSKSNIGKKFPSNMLKHNSPFPAIQHNFSIIDVYPAISEQYKIKEEDLRLLLTRYMHENKRLKEQIKKRSFVQRLLQFKKKLFA